MFARTAEVDRITELLLSGRGVNLVGGRGSGRSETLKRVRQQLLARDRQVITVRGIGTEVALEALRIGLPATARKNLGSRGAVVGALVDEFERVLGQEPTVILLDDANQLDRASWMVLESIHKATGVPVLATDLRRAAADAPHQSLMAIAHPVVQISLDELGLASIHELLEARLGGPLDPALGSRVHTMSGGTPGIARAVIDSAVSAGLVHRADGVWRGDDALWNDDLIGVFESLVTTYPRPLQEAMEMLAIVGVTDWRSAERLVGQDVLETLEGHGLTRVVVANATAMIAVHPAGVVDYFRNQPLSARRMRLVERVSESLGRIPAEERAEHVEYEWRQLQSASGEVPLRRSVELLVLAQMFTEDFRMRATAAERRWREEPSTRSAADLLLVGLTGRLDQALLDDVIARGRDSMPSDPIAEVELRWLTARALLAQGASLETAREAVLPGIRDGFSANAALQAISEVLDVEMNSAAEVDMDFLRDLAAGDGFGAQVASVALAGALIVRGDGAGALTVIDATPKGERTPLVNTHLEVLRGLALAASGQHLAATRWATSQLELAIADLDRLSLAGHAYVAAIGLTCLSRYQEAADIASVTLRIGARATPLLLAPDRALVMLLWVLSALDGRPSAAEGYAAAAEAVHPRSHALPLSSQAWGQAVSHLIDGQRSRARDDFAALSAELYGRGYAYAGDVAAFLSRVSKLDAASAPDPAGFGSTGGGLFEAYVAARHAAINDDAAGVEQAAESLAALGAAPAAAKYLGQAARLYREAGAGADASRLRTRMLELGGAASGASSARLDSEPLTGREAEIARLIGAGLTNSQIASRLVISVRTVESHINNIRRKTGAADRSELGSLV